MFGGKYRVKDPDIVMVGEMRDKETTSIGIEASLTGHLVFSTLHTNSAPESITRLLDMGMDPFNFADALLAIMAQRLVRRTCRTCRRGRVAAPACTSCAPPPTCSRPPCSQRSEPRQELGNSGSRQRQGQGQLAAAVDSGSVS